MKNILLLGLVIALPNLILGGPLLNKLLSREKRRVDYRDDLRLGPPSDFYDDYNDDTWQYGDSDKRRFRDEEYFNDNDDYDDDLKWQHKPAKTRKSGYYDNGYKHKRISQHNKGLTNEILKENEYLMEQVDDLSERVDDLESMLRRSQRREYDYELDRGFDDDFFDQYDDDDYSDEDYDYNSEEDSSEEKKNSRTYPDFDDVEDYKMGYQDLQNRRERFDDIKDYQRGYNDWDDDRQFPSDRDDQFPKEAYREDFDDQFQKEFEDQTPRKPHRKPDFDDKSSEEDWGQFDDDEDLAEAGSGRQSGYWEK